MPTPSTSAEPRQRPRRCIHSETPAEPRVTVDVSARPFLSARPNVVGHDAA
jgi:hypothetical protein